MRILLVEDEFAIAQPLINGLKENGFAVDYAKDGGIGYSMAYENQYDCIVLDLNLPVLDGIDLLKKLRDHDIVTPILILSARSAQYQILEGFKNGTDDYLTKPFDFMELQYRINAIIKRNSFNKSEILEAGNIKLEINSHSVRVDNSEIKLNNKEYGILLYLLRNKGKVISQEELLEHVWDKEVDLFTQTVRTNIKTLRQKIDPTKSIIINIKGCGYKIEK